MLQFFGNNFADFRKLMYIFYVARAGAERKFLPVLCFYFAHKHLYQNLNMWTKIITNSRFSIISSSSEPSLPRAVRQQGFPLRGGLQRVQVELADGRWRRGKVARSLRDGHNSLQVPGWPDHHLDLLGLAKGHFQGVDFISLRFNFPRLYTCVYFLLLILNRYNWCIFDEKIASLLDEMERWNGIDSVQTRA
jgi:hypothetical protein